MQTKTNISQDDITLMLITKYKLVLPAPKHVRTSGAELRIAPAKFLFNRATISELGYPEHVCFLLSEDNKKLVVRSAVRNEFTVPFCAFDSEQNLISKPPICIGNKILIQSLRQFFGWDKKATYVVPAIRYGDEHLLLFDLEKAYIRTKEHRRTHVTLENALDSYPRMADIVNSYQQLSIGEKSEIKNQK